MSQTLTAQDLWPLVQKLSRDEQVRMRRGEIRWYTFAAPDKRRPVLLLTRDEVIDA